MTVDQWIALIAALVGGALRVGVPFLFVSLGETLTEKSGRINLGLEGVLVLSAMSAFGGAYLSGSAWIGVLVAAAAGAALAALHAGLCSLPRVNDVATGIALMLLGMGLAFYWGKPLIQPQAPQIPALPLGEWSDIPAVRAALQVNALQYQHRCVGQSESALQQASCRTEATEQDGDRDDGERVMTCDECDQDARIAIAHNQRGIG